MEALGEVLGKLAFWTTIVFFILKVTRWVSWSWWAVFSPLWGLAAGLGVALVLAASWDICVAAVQATRRRKSIVPRTYDVSHIETLESIKNPRKV